MPDTLTAYRAGVWFLVGLCTGLGWAIAQWIVARLTR